MKKSLVYIGILAALAVACSKGAKQPAYVVQPSDSVYTAQNALSVYAKDPARALVIIDSALIVGNTSQFEADYVKATIYGRSPIDPQKDKALRLCLELLQSDSTQAVDATRAKHRMDVLDIMAGIYRVNNDDENGLKYAIELVDLYRAWGYEANALRAEAEMGVMLTSIGREEEGLKKIDTALEGLSKDALSMDCLDGWIVSAKRKIKVLFDLHRQEEVLPLAQQIIDKLDHFQSHYEDYEQDCTRLRSDYGIHMRWSQFYQSQAHGFLGAAYAMMGKLKEARKEMAIYEDSDLGRSFSGRRTISPTWKLLGEWDKLLDIDAQMESRMGADTINADYAVVLRDRSDAANAHGRYQEALAWLGRYVSLQEKLVLQQQKSQAHDYAAKYHAKEQEMDIQMAREEARMKNKIIIAIFVLFVLTAVALVYFAWQRKIISKKNKALVRLINDKTHVSREAPQTQPSDQMRELFQAIDSAIRSEKLYANASLQRQDILDRFNLRRQALNEVIAAFTDEDSFPSYINNIRLDEAVRLLRKERNLTITAIADAVGFSPANFRIAFKQRFAITPAEYRNNA